MTAQSAWFSSVAPYAEEVHAATGVLTGVLLAVMALETGYGTSQLAHQNNLSGIKYEGQPGTSGQDGPFATYSSPQAWAADMSHELSLPRYAGVRRAQGAMAQMSQFAMSGYDGGSFAQQQEYGSTLVKIYAEQGLAAYDGAGPVTASPSQLLQLPGGASVQTSGCAPSVATFLLAAATAAGCIAELRHLVGTP
ncbi:MAG: glucosaminidase domain-containing protein [Candidatus Xenobia bacterium]